MTYLLNYLCVGAAKYLYADQPMDEKRVMALSMPESWMGKTLTAFWLSDGGEDGDQLVVDTDGEKEYNRQRSDESHKE